MDIPTLLVANQVQAYVNHGRWIADCCRQYCGNAMKLERRQAVFQCASSDGCGMEAVVVWPPNADELTEVLRARPVPSTRNWFPSGHELALRAGCESGQTVQQLKDEQMDMESKP